ncbi:MAG: hypothetical protein PHV32_08405 [Eubacteriales bacterium]|nr:hypothetical protein [Eubacteriales bacterium]
MMDFLKKVISYLRDSSRVLLEAAAANEKKRYIISTEEWANIKDWYYDKENKEDYLMTLDENLDSYTLVRLTKGVIELRVWEVTRLDILMKNIWNLMITPVPRIIRFFTAFFLAVLVWPVVVPISFITHQELTESAKQLATNLTSVIFLVFLLCNLIFLIFKTVDAFISKYRAFFKKQETFIMDTLIFNLGLLALFSAIGGSRLVETVLSFWEYAKKFIG